ncbi:MAG: TRAP transporter large permease subunit [Rhodospirillales bacterium]|jgi:tripartite ATP-independent transporter DctM subunit|nr:C4-dicarboxylate ABC transporter permease [Rhodospirillaceae bacterium]MDP6430229.1 TRAP transporter large permease subunit [Rhodospirillales bacterium]MDP6646218.1 TRAP transporter large permease subunit [Rhodospirillales bacterium]MDP6840136.1 TRAP transporter large permease subunit [Rhodospirillales bacterium]
MIVSLAGLAILLVVVFMGVPLGFAMMIVGFVGYGFVRGFEPGLIMAGQQILDLAMNYSFSVLPLFILMGVFVAHAALSDDLYDASDKWLGHFKGGLAMATVAACGGFAAISGSSLATAATMAKVAIPAMRKYDYSDSLAAGTLGMLIPPSAAMIVYGILTETDIAKLFIGGIIPGLITVVVYIIVISGVVRVWPHLGPPGHRSSWAERFTSLYKVWGVLVLFLLILGGIFFGVFTPTEAGGIGAVGALAFALGRRKMSWERFYASLIEAASITATIFSVAFGALILNQFVNIAGLPQAMVATIGGFTTPIYAILVILGIYVIMGTVIEGFAIIFLTAPIFVPVVEALGFDLIWFGIVMIMVVEISLITPPIGLNVFVLKSMLPEVPLASIFKGIAPFFAADIMRLMIVVFVPGVVLYLPSLMR